MIVRASALFLFIALLFFASATNASAEDSTARRALATLDRERISLKSLSFNALIETPKAEGRWSKIELTFSYMAPNLFRSKLKMGIEGSITTVSDGEAIWLEYSREKKIYRETAAKNKERLLKNGPIDPVSAIAGSNVPLAELFTAEKATRDGNAIRLVLVPRKKVPGYDRLELYLIDGGRTPQRAVTYSKGKIVAKITFRDLKKNVAMKKESFIFTPPPTAEVVPI